MFNLCRSVRWQPFLFDEFSQLVSFNQLKVSPIIASHEEFVEAQTQEEEDACRYSESAPNTVTNLAKVCSDATTAHAISKKKHEIGRITMHLGDVVYFVTFSPRLVSIVPLHHTSCHETRHTHENRDDQSNQAEDRVGICLLFPVDVGVDLHAGANGNCSH